MAEEQPCYNFYMQSYFPAVRENTKAIGRHNELFKQIDLNTDILSKNRYIEKSLQYVNGINGDERKKQKVHAGDYEFL